MKNELLQKIIRAAWLLCLLGFALPISRIWVNGKDYFQFLLTNYAGIIAFAVTLLLALVQALMFGLKKKWLIWPGLVAGFYLVMLCINLCSEIFSRLKRPDPNHLTIAFQVEINPMPGLFILAVGSVLLLALSAWQLANLGKRSRLTAM